MTWIELESIRVREISQSEEDRYHMISLICEIKQMIWEIKQMGKGKKREANQETESLCFVLFDFNFLNLNSICQHKVQHLVLIPSSALLSAQHLVTPSPHLPPFPQPLVCFPELEISHGLSPSLIFPHLVLTVKN